MSLRFNLQTLNINDETIEKSNQTNSSYLMKCYSIMVPLLLRDFKPEISIPLLQIYAIETQDTYLATVTDYDKVLHNYSQKLFDFIALNLRTKLTNIIRNIKDNINDTQKLSVDNFRDITNLFKDLQKYNFHISRGDSGIRNTINSDELISRIDCVRMSLIAEYNDEYKYITAGNTIKTIEKNRSFSTDKILEFISLIENTSNMLFNDFKPYYDLKLKAVLDLIFILAVINISYNRCNIISETLDSIHDQTLSSYPLCEMRSALDASGNDYWLTLDMSCALCINMNTKYNLKITNKNKDSNVKFLLGISQLLNDNSIESNELVSL